MSKSHANPNGTAMSGIPRTLHEIALRPLENKNKSLKRGNI